MIFNLDHKNFLYLSIIGILLIFAFYLSYVGGYGSDEDTLPMIHVFEARLADGTFISSRFTGYPVSEIGIDFIALFWKLDCKFSNICILFPWIDIIFSLI